jgi:hypothetical protein
VRLRDADQQLPVDYLQITKYVDWLARPDIVSPYITTYPSFPAGWQVFGGEDGTVAWASGPATPGFVVNLWSEGLSPEFYIRMQGYLAADLQWDYLLAVGGSRGRPMELVSWYDPSHGWMGYQWNYDLEVLEEAPVEDAYVLSLVNTPIARVVAPPVPEPALVQMAVLTGLGALGLARLRRKA